MQIKINKMIIQNFQKIKYLEVDLQGKNASIYGTNRAGKTTIASSLTWGFSGKDSLGRADFDIKNHDAKSDDNVSVKHYLNIDGQELILERVLIEKHKIDKKTRKKHFNGYTTKYYINDSKKAVTKKVFDATIDSIVDGELLSVLIDPFKFNSMSWQDMRRYLVDLSPPVNDSDIVDSISGLSVDMIGPALKESWKAEQKDLDDKLNENEIIIKDLFAKPAAPPIDQEEKIRLESELKLKADELQDIDNGVAESKKQIEINKIDSEIISIRNEAPDINKLKKTILDKIAEIEQHERELKANQARRSTILINDKLQREMLESERKVCLTNWHTENDKLFNAECTCELCGQDIPATQIEQAQRNFNNSKAEKLAEIVRLGKGFKGDIEDTDIRIKNINIEIKEGVSILESVKQDIDAEHKKLDGIKPEEDGPEIKKLESKRSAIQKGIEALKAGIDIQKKPLKATIDKTKESLRIIDLQGLEVEADKKRLDRISQLEDEEKNLSAQIEDIERKLSLLLEFDIAKMTLIEKMVNEKFSSDIKFKLFKEFINQDSELKPDCICLVDGVRYDHGLNTEGRINAGLSIIKTIFEHYEISVPVFIDNAEAVVLPLVDTGNQTIKLYPKLDAKTIEIVTEEK